MNSRLAYRLGLADISTYVSRLVEVADAAKWLRQEQKRVCEGHDARGLVCRCEQLKRDVEIATDLLDRALAVLASDQERQS